MSYQLKIDEMLDSLCTSEHPQASQFTQMVEATADVLASALSQQLGIDFEPASFQGHAFAGTCVPFSPRYPGQELPTEIAMYDNEEEWGA